MSKIIQFSLARNSDPQEARPTVEALRAEVRAQAVAVEAVAEEWAVRDGPVTFKEFEGALRLVVFSLARAVIMLFLARREAHLMQEFPRQVEREGRHFRAAPAQSRALTTLFGVVRYWRTYFRETGAEDKCGFHPLDQSLGLSGDRFSWSVLSHGVWLALRLSFAEARTALARFIPDAPSTEVVEQSVLGFGRYTEEWFEQQPPPAGDGEVLIMQFDSKGAPTATATELKRRRGPRRRRKPAPSRRHAGRTRRKGYTKKKRRNKGDKSKNAKMATLVVMYTLRREGDLLLGPLNRWHYASFAPKRRAFEVARREADKRGFTRDSGKTVQIVTDGDHDLACYAAQYFPEAKVTIDVMHVIEKLWTAGESLYPEGSRELQEWVELQKERLYGGQVPALLTELRQRLAAIPKTGPGNKGKRERLAQALRYLEKREAKLNYRELLAQDLEIGSGMVEGAVKNLIAKRCDHGGMRWIKERAEAILQLRCIDANGDWDAFSNFVHDRLQSHATLHGIRQRLQCSTPAPLPTCAETPCLT